MQMVNLGKSVLDHLQSEYLVLPSELHVDLLQTVWNLATQSALTINWHHVQGHQDGCLITALAQDVWLNIEANSLAKTTVNLMYQGPNKFHLPREGWVWSIGSKWIVKQMASTVWDHVNGHPAEKYWKTKLKMLLTLWDSIKWQGLDCAYQESSITTQWWAVKYTLGFFSHGKNMTHWNLWSISSCLRCTEALEDKAHIMQCLSKWAQ